MPQYLSPGVYVEEVDSGSRPLEGVATSVAAFVGQAGMGPFNTPTLVTNWTQFTQTFGDFLEGSYLAHAVYGFFLNGGSIAYVVRVGEEGAAPVARGELAAGTGDAKGPALRFSAIEPGPQGHDIAVEVADAPEGAPEDAFRIVVRQGGKVVEEFNDVSMKKGKTNAVATVNAQSKLVRIEEPTGAGALERPANATVSLAGGGQSAPSDLRPDDYVGDSADRTGFGGLEAIEDITMIAVPDLMAAHQRGQIDGDGVKAVQLAMIAHCELMGNRVAILDAPPGLNAQQIREWRVDRAQYDSKFATLYWPWIKVFDPATGDNVFVPPSGHMAGVWARNDATRGVHKAPANEQVRGAISLQTTITRNEHDTLNPSGINCIRSFPGRGIKVWGARTLSSDPAWRYLNERRLFNYLSETIQRGTDWVVFEPNDQALWARIRRTIASFLITEWRKGALFGLTPDEAFYVKCDSETNPPESVELGQVTCEIGVAPVKPAEFVIFRMSKYTGGAAE